MVSDMVLIRICNLEVGSELKVLILTKYLGQAGCWVDLGEWGLDTVSIPTKTRCCLSPSCLSACSCSFPSPQG